MPEGILAFKLSSWAAPLVVGRLVDTRKSGLVAARSTLTGEHLAEYVGT
jgi:hypothetical protein